MSQPGGSQSSEGLGAAPPVCAVCREPHATGEACATSVRPAPGAPGAAGGTSVFGIPQPEDPLLGQTIGNFRIVRKLGSGGMGVVYLGEHAVIGSRVAVKMLHPHLASDSRLVERFYAEARAVNLIGHENIVSVFDLNLLPPNHYYLIMEYLDGRPLSSLVGSPVDDAVSVPILAQMCDALDAAHAAGVIHRDLKPENIFLVKRGRIENFVKLVDFGIAKLRTGITSNTMVGMVVGTPEFMAPEQWTGEEIDGRADLYAVGVVGYVLATGRLPFAGDGVMALYLAHRDKAPTPVRVVNPKASEGLESVIARALAKKREDRFATAGEMREALLALTSRRVEAAVAPPAAKPPPPAPAPKRVQPSWTVRVAPAGEQSAETVRAVDLTRGGLFVCTGEPFPAAFTRVAVALVHENGELALDAEVVRHVGPEQAKAWGMEAGFAVQFVGLTSKGRAAIDRLVQGLAVQDGIQPGAAGGWDDPKVEELLEGFRQGVSGDHYALLGVPLDAECSDVRHRGRQVVAQLEAVRQANISSKQREQVETLLERIHAAITVLGTPNWRADYDAAKGNFRGVARCLSAGLPIAALEALHASFLAKRPANRGAAQVHLMAANAHAGSRQMEQALGELESALRVDPLSLELHQRYWTLKRSAVRSGVSGAPGGRSA